MKSKRIFAALAAAVICSSMFISGCVNTRENEEASKSSSVQSSVNSEVSEKESSKDENVSENEKSELTSEQSSEPAKSTITPAVWEVTDSNGNSLYMMGTIHVADADAEVLPDYFEAAYAKCDALAVECDTDSMDIDMSIYTKLMYTDGTTIKEHVPEEQYNTVVKELANAGQYMAAFDYMKPALWSNYVELAAASKAGLSTDYGIDYNMLDRAKEEGKEILELESVDFQLNLMANLSDDIQTLLFKEIAQEGIIDEYAKELAELYNEWKKGNEISNDDDVAGESSIDKKDLELAEEYNKILVDDRNVGMAKKIKSYIDDGKKVMVLAGSAHFYGEKGIIKLLENEGYTIRKLTSDDAKDFAVSEQTSENAESKAESSAVVENDPGVPRAA